MVVRAVLNLILWYFCPSHVLFKKNWTFIWAAIPQQGGWSQSPWFIWKGVSSLTVKRNEKHQASFGPQAPANILWVLSWNGYVSQRSFLKIFHVSPKDWAQPCLKEGFGSKRGSSTLGPACSPQITGRYFGTKQHLSLNQMLCVSAVQGSSPHHFWNMWCALGSPHNT